MSTDNGATPARDPMQRVDEECQKRICHLLSDATGMVRLRTLISKELRRSVNGFHNEERTEEVFQEVCVKALAKRIQFDPLRSNGYPWLYKMAVRAIADGRKKNRKLNLICSDNLRQFCYESSANEMLPNPDLARVRAVIASLSEADQKIYEEYFVNGKRRWELANALGCRTLEATRTRVHRFKRSFEKAFFAKT